MTQVPVPGRARLLALADDEPDGQEHAQFNCHCQKCDERRAEEREQMAREDSWGG